MMAKLLAVIVVLFVSAALAVGPACAVVYVKWDSPGPSLDGNSWDTAYHSMQQGLDDAVAGGEEVRVARGAYAEQITLKAGVALKGGYSGVGDARDIRANVTIVDGSQAGGGHTVIGANTSSIDGFTIYGGDEGVYCNATSPTASHNVIKAAASTGVYCISSTAVIVNNVICGNVAGITCDICSPTITSNTIVANDDIGICLSGQSRPTMSNNIVAFNAYGIYKWLASGDTAPTQTKNDVYGNTKANYTGVSQGGDISPQDPLFISLATGGLRIQAGSPCRNAGSNSAPSLSSTDIDGQTRIEGTTVDIGADESYGEAGAAARVVYVSASAPAGSGFQVPSQQGGSWATAYSTIQAAIEDAFLMGGGEVWVAKGIYTEQVTMRPFVSLYGGFAGNENTRSARVPSANQTVIDSPQPNVPSVWTANYVTLDGFTIRGGYHGVSCYYTSPTITNNIIVANGKTGVHCHGGSAVVTNNTILGNDAGISCDSASPKIHNNIVAYNRTGIASAGSPVLSRNDVYGSTSANYYGVSAGSGDIQLNPQFASLTTGNLHIQSGSPCRNAGSGTAPGLPAYDTDGQARVQGSAPDIGADESYGEGYSVPTRVLRVNAAAAPGGDGTSWATAYRTIGAAIDDAALNGGAEIWVARGIYAEQVVMRAFAHLYGGFAGTESARAYRNVRANPTVIDGNSLDSAATVVRASSLATLDGFTVTGGFVGVGSDFGSPSIVNDTVCDNEGYGIVCGSSATVNGNLVFSNGNGVACVSGRPTVSLNTIASNVDCGVTSGSGAVIAGNVISGNTMGVLCDYESPTLTNNTIVSNSAQGIIYDYASSPVISNNISAWNAYGIFNDLGTYEDAGNTWGSPTLTRNDVFGNTKGSFTQMSQGQTDIIVSPMLASLQFGDYHIQDSSPCRNAGSNSASAPLTVDLDGQARIGGGTVDIGADEVYGETYPVPYIARIIHVNGAAPSGGDGATWATAYRRMQDAMQNAYANGGAEVWVARGNYPENVLMAPWTYLYGGFIGTESARSFRDAGANVTVVDATSTGSSAAAVTCAGSGGIDGFTVRGGGAGISAVTGSPVVSDNIVSASAGSGIVCGGSAQVVNCLVVGNGAGIECVSGEPLIVNNTVADNGQAGLAYIYGTSPKFINDISAFNSIGVLADPDSPGAATFSHNNAFGNSTANYSGRAAAGWDISSDPRFVDRAAGDYHVQQASLSIDAGDPSGSSWLADDFNSYPDGSLGGHGGWTGGGSAVRVQSSIAVSGKAIEANYKLWGIGDASMTVSPGSAYQYMDFDAAMNSAGSGHGSNLGYLMLYGPLGTEITRVYFAAQVLKVLLGPVSSPTPTLILDNVPNYAWQHIRLGVNASSTIDVWVNGVRVVTGGAPYHTESSIARIAFGQWNSGGMFTTSETYIDNLMCQCPSAPSIVPVLDLDCTARPLDGNGDATALVDMGCYEYLPNRTDIATAKSGADGAPVGFSGLTSTACLADRFYIESPDGVSGIGVLGGMESYGKRMTVTGTMTTVDGERMVLPSSINQGDDAAMPPAPFMVHRALGGAAFGLQDGITGSAGLNNIGLLAVVFGRVTEIAAQARARSAAGAVEQAESPTWFKIDDGSGVNVKCVVPAGVVIDQGWQYVRVTGISSCETAGGNLRPLLRVRAQGDIVPILP